MIQDENWNSEEKMELWEIKCNAPRIIRAKTICFTT